MLDLLANDPANSAAWLGLCIRHIVTQDSLLVDQVLKTTPQHPVTDFSDPRNQAETTLRAYPVERSKDALAALKWVDPSTPAATNRPRRRHSR